MTHTKDDLRILQGLPLDLKIRKTQQRIQEWYEYFDGEVYVGFSGGKDSTVLLDLVRRMYPEVPAVYCDTGLEYPELKAFVRNKPGVEIVRPAMTFTNVITKYGYPMVSKEVAEAIYYARRILPEDKPSNMTGGVNALPQTDGTLRTPVRRNEATVKRTELMGRYTNSRDSCFEAIGRFFSDGATSRERGSSTTGRRASPRNSSERALPETPCAECGPIRSTNSTHKNCVWGADCVQLHSTDERTSWDSGRATAQATEPG